MALTFPLSLAAFFDDLCIAEASFYLAENSVYSRTGAGEIIGAQVGPSLWRGTVSLRPHKIDDALMIAARLDTLRIPGRSFLVSPYGGEFPRMDPDGIILGLANPLIGTVNANRVTVGITNLPSGYKISQGDFLSVEYGTPVRYGLYQIASGGTANGSGVATVEVSRPLSAGIVPGMDVRLVNPICKSVIAPGEYTPFSSTRRRWSSGLSFGFIQTMR